MPIAPLFNAESPDPAQGQVPPWRAALYRYVPALNSLRTYTTSDFSADLVAGVTVAAVAVPQSMAYAQIAGIPPQYGLYTAIVMTAVGALFDSSKQLINGPTNAISIATFSALATFSDADRIQAAVLLALLVGAVQVSITLLRLGDLNRYISHAVIVGFTLGAAVLLVLDQLKNILGLPAQGSGEDHFLKRLWLTLSQGSAVHLPTLLIGLGSIALVLLIRLLNTRLSWRVPEFLLTIIVLAAVVAWLRLDEQGVKVIGQIPSDLPGFQLPVFEWAQIHELLGSGLAIAVLGLLEAIAMAKAVAAKTRQKLDINQQCLSEGLANVAGSLFQCFPGSGSLTRSNINQQAGAVSQWSGVISAIAVAATVVVFAPYARYIPKASLAGILMVSAWRLVDRRQLAYHLRATQFDAIIVLLTAVSAVVVSIEFCILIGVFLSFVMYVPRAARIELTELTLTPQRVLRERVAEDAPCDRILIFDLEGELFFGAAPQLEEHFESIAKSAAEREIRVVLLRIKRARNPDAVCLELLEKFIDQMHAQGVVVLLCGVRADVAQVLRACGIEAHVGAANIFRETGAIWSATLDAVRHAYDLIQDDVCEHCPRHAESLNQRDGWNYVI